jgi:cytochrome b561
LEFAQGEETGNNDRALLECSFRGETHLILNHLTLQQMIHPVDETVTIQLTCRSLVWLALGFSPAGVMKNSMAVIGLPEQGTVWQYNLTGKSSPSQMIPMPDETLSLTNDVSIVQNDTHTILTFTQPLQQTGQVSVNAKGNATNTVIWAIGDTNQLGYHGQRGSYTMDFDTCDSLPGSRSSSGGGAVKLFNPHEGNKTLWKVHGWFMAIACGILIPLAIGSSLLRSVLPLPPGVWFRLHFYTNAIALLMMLASFGIACYLIEKEGLANHFTGKHKSTGLIIVVIATLQAMNGVFRPHVKNTGGVQHHGSDNNDTYLYVNVPTYDADDELAQQQHNADIDKKPINKKTMLRTFWEYLHRIVGFLLLALAWYGVDTGFISFARRYPPADTSTARAVFWGVVGGLTGLITLMTLCIRLRQCISSSPTSS